MKILNINNVSHTWNDVLSLVTTGEPWCLNTRGGGTQTCDRTLDWSGDQLQDGWIISCVAFHTLKNPGEHSSWSGRHLRTSTGAPGGIRSYISHQLWGNESLFTVSASYCTRAGQLSCTGVGPWHPLSAAAGCTWLMSQLNIHRAITNKPNY